METLTITTERTGRKARKSLNGRNDFEKDSISHDRGKIALIDYAINHLIRKKYNVAQIRKDLLNEREICEGRIEEIQWGNY